MPEHLSERTLAGYRDRSLSPDELLTADDHLASCAQCRDSLLDGSTLRDAYVAMRSDLLMGGDEGTEHLSYETLTAYVESSGFGLSGRMDPVDREIVESHIDHCESCAAEVRELRAFQNVLQNSPEVAYTPKSRQEPWWASWTSRMSIPRLAFGGAIAAGLIAAVVFAAHPWSRTTTTPAPDLASTARPGSAPGPATPGKTTDGATGREAGSAGPAQMAQTAPPTTTGASGPNPVTSDVRSGAPKPGAQTAQTPHPPASKRPETGISFTDPNMESSGAIGEESTVAGIGAHRRSSRNGAEDENAEPTDAKALVTRGNERIGLGQYDLAIADFTKATKLSPNLSRAWEGLSWAYYFADKFSDALTSNAKAIDLSKDPSFLRFRRGLIYATSGDWKNGKAEYQTALSVATPGQLRAALKEAREAQLNHPDVPALTSAIDYLKAAGAD